MNDPEPNPSPLTSPAGTARESPARDIGKPPVAVSSTLVSTAGWIASRRGLARLGLAAGFGICAALAMAPFHVVPLLIVAFTGLVWQLDGLAGALRPRAMSALVGWAFGVGFCAVGLYWVGDAFLVDAKEFAALLPVAMLAMCAGLSLFPAAGMLLARLVPVAGPGRVALFAVGWSLAEWARGHWLTGFPWNLTGYTWGTALPVLQVTALVGSYGLSLLTAFAAASPAALVTFKNGRAAAAPLAALVWLGACVAVFAGVFVFGVWRLELPPPPPTGISLRLVQPSVPQIDKITSGNAGRIFAEHMALSQRPGLDKTKIIIWTEAAVPTLLADDSGALAAIGALLQPGQWLLAGSARYVPSAGAGNGRYFNSLLAIDSDGKVQFIYDKHHLVPFGEYLPLKSVLSAFGLRQLVEAQSGFTAGPGLRTLMLPGIPKMGPLVCYEAIFPGAVVQPGRRPDWLLNVTDDTWFGLGSGPRQHFESARIRAIEEGLPLVRAANNGISAVIGARGKIQARLGLNKVGILDAPLPGALEPTLYARIGDAGYLIGLLLMAGAGLLGIKRLGKG